MQILMMKKLMKLMKMLADDNPTEQIEIVKIQLPGGSVPKEEQDGPLFNNAPSFNYEKDALEKVKGKFNNLEMDPTGSNSNGQSDQYILDKYKDELKKMPNDPKEVKKELRRQKTLKKKQIQKEIQKIQCDMDIWGEKIDNIASIIRLVGLVFVTILCGVGIFFLIRKFGDNKFLLWLGLEVLNDAVIIFLCFNAINTVNSTKVDINPVNRLKIFIYISFGVQGLMIILGFALMKYSGGFKLNGTRDEQSKAMYKILGIVFILLCLIKGGLLGYVFYLYRKYLPYYEEYFEKTNADPDYIENKDNDKK